MTDLDLVWVRILLLLFSTMDVLALIEVGICYSEAFLQASQANPFFDVSEPPETMMSFHDELPWKRM